MHPLVKKICDRYPRTYGFFALLVAVGLFALGRNTKNNFVLIFASLLAPTFGFVGVLYLIFGTKCNEWDEKFKESFNPNNLSWRQALILIGIGLIWLATYVCMKIHFL